MGDYHGKMMNAPDELKTSYPTAEYGHPLRRAYLIGHRDARHACAEIALEADEEIRRTDNRAADIEGTLEKLIDTIDNEAGTFQQTGGSFSDLDDMLAKLLRAARDAGEVL